MSAGSGGQVAAAIAQVTALSGGDHWFLVLAGRQAGEDWWSRDQAIDALDELFAAFPPGAGRSAEAVQGSLRLEAWAWTIRSPATAALLATGVALDLAAGGVQVQAPPGQRPVFAAWDLDAPGAQAPRVADPSDPASIDLLLGPMVAHLAPLVAAISARTGRSRAALWRGVRDRLAGALLWAGEATGKRGTAELMLHHAVGHGRVRGPVPRLVGPDGAPAALGSTPNAPQFGLQTDGAKPELIRGGCCLWWRAGHDPCETCPLSHRGGVKH